MTNELDIALQRLVTDSGLTPHEIAEAIGKAYSTLMREANPNDHRAKIGAITLYQIMALTGNINPLRIMAANLGYELIPVKHQ